MSQAGTAPRLLADLVALIDRDADRDRRSLWLTANEGMMSRTAGTFLNSTLSNRYYSGAGDEDAVVTNPYTPFMSRGRPGVAELVGAASRAAAAMLDASIVNLNCLSGIHAMTSTILALSEPRDAVMSVEVGDGGHFATRHVVERCGRRWAPAPVDQCTWLIDPRRLASACDRFDVRLLYIDCSYELSPQDVAAIRRAVGDDVSVVYDVSHTLGLIMGGVLASPLSLGADAICGNTHKTLSGPHRGLIAYRDPELAAKADAIIDGGLYSSNHLMTLIALCVTVLEMQRWGGDYAGQVVANARRLAAALTRFGWELRPSAGGEFTSTHQIHVFSEALAHHRLLYGRFSASNIALGFDNCLGGRTFIRLGTQEVTRRGMGDAEMQQVAGLLVGAAAGEDVSTEVADLALRHERACYSFDDRPEQILG